MSALNDHDVLYESDYDKVFFFVKIQESKMGWLNINAANVAGIKRR